jgi:hypothetical protein
MQLQVCLQRFLCQLCMSDLQWPCTFGFCSRHAVSAAERACSVAAQQLQSKEQVEWGLNCESTSATNTAVNFKGK